MSFRTDLAAFALFAGLCLPGSLRAQGGPPLVTDDPGTPGPGRWEINTAATVELGRDQRLWDVPLVDANYGWGERIQLKVEIPWRVRTAPGGETVSGLGEVLIGVKWRFLDEDSSGIGLGVYPQAGFRTISSSARLGLAEPYTSVFLPAVAQKDLGFLSVNLEAGWQWRSTGRSHEFAGLALGRRLSERLEILGEVFADSPGQLSETSIGWHVGGRCPVARWLVLLFSGGTGIRGSAAEPRSRFSGYLGTQLLL